MILDLEDQFVDIEHNNANYISNVVIHILMTDINAGTTNPGGTKKLNNPPKVIRNPIPQDPDNPIK